MKWGLLDQGFSSLTNFGLTVVAGRLLGPAGLGATFVGFSVYVIALTLQRTLVTDPHVTTSSSLEGPQLHSSTSNAITAALVVEASIATLMIAAGMGMAGDVGRALVWFGIWLVPALIQDFVRTILFRDGAGAIATLSDGTWAFVMVATLPFILGSDNLAYVVSWWGLGASAGCVAGLWKRRISFAKPLVAWDWWRRGLWSFAKWLLAENLVSACLQQGLNLILVVLLGPSSLGGLRAVASVLTPLSLLAPAISLPGLPALSALIEVDPYRAQRLSTVLSAAATIATMLYLAVAFVLGGYLLDLLFGAEFRRFSDLLVPLGMSQVAAAASGGAFLLLKAARRTKRLAFARVVGSIGQLGAVTLLAISFGIYGASWGLVIGAMLTTALLVFHARVHVRTGSQSTE